MAQCTCTTPSCNCERQVLHVDAGALWASTEAWGPVPFLVNFAYLAVYWYIAIKDPNYEPGQ